MKTLIAVALLVAVATLVASQKPTLGEALSLGKLPSKEIPQKQNIAQLRSASFCLSEHNAARARNGKGALKGDAKLAAAAQRHNEYMAQKNCFSHQCAGEPGLADRVNSQNYLWSALGENIAKGHTSCQHAVNGWMNSPGHKANILGNFENVGCHRLANGNYYTCVFGNTRNW